MGLSSSFSEWRYRRVKLGILAAALMAMCSSCGHKDTANTPGPWKLQNAALLKVVPASEGDLSGANVEIELFSANDKPRWLGMTLTFDKPPSRLELEAFQILAPSGERVHGSSIHSSIDRGDSITLVFASQEGWDKNTKLVLSGLDHRVPFRTPADVAK